MDVGLMWFDNSNDKTPIKVQRAAEYYQLKHGQAPNTCYLHPATNDGSAAPAGIEIRESRKILPNHFWLGVSNSNYGQRRTRAGSPPAACFGPQGHSFNRKEIPLKPNILAKLPLPFREACKLLDLVRFGCTPLRPFDEEQ